MALLGGVVAMAGASRSAAQNPRVGGDVAVFQRYIFRGEIMASRPAIAPRIWLNASSRLGDLSLGAWSLIEPLNPQRDDFSLRGSGTTTPSEWDIWTETANRVFGQDVTVGATRYHTGSGPDGRMTFWPSSEVYVATERAAGSPISESWWYRARYWWGVERSRRQYGELTLGPQWLLAPSRDISLSLTGGLGINVRTPMTDMPVATYPATRGLSHYSLALTLVSVPSCDDTGDATPIERVRDLILPNQFSVRTRIGRDAATRALTRTQDRATVTGAEAVWTRGHCTQSRARP
ncbi:MAG: hypothetical protein NVS1B4_08400 [Gemmatimonadaceae bacterium]